MSSTSSSWRRGRAALRARRDVVDRRDRLAARVAVVHGDAVAPPQLARDAPVADVLHPVEVDVLPALGVERRRGRRGPPRWPGPRAASCPRTTGPTATARRPCGSGSSGRPSADGRTSPRAGPAPRGPPRSACAPRSGRGPAYGPPSAEIVASAFMMLTLAQPCRSPISKSLGSCAGVTLTAPVPNAGSTYSSATIGISRPSSGSTTVAPTRSRVALVVRVHRHARVAEHRLGPGRGHDDVVAAADRLLERVADGPQVPVDLLVLHLDVGERRGAARAPVDDALAAVDEPLLVPVHEHRAHRELVAGVHRELLVVVVAASTPSP